MPSVLPPSAIRTLQRLSLCTVLLAAVAVPARSHQREPIEEARSAPTLAPLVPRVCGRVVSSTGERIADAHVRLDYRASSASVDGVESVLEIEELPLLGLDARSDRAGEFSFALHADLRIHSAQLHVVAREQSLAGHFELRRVLTRDELLSGRCLQERVLCLGKRWQPDDRLFGEVRVDPIGSASGRVLDAEGRPVAGARVSAESVARELVHAETDATGLYQLDGVPVGEHIVRVRADGYALRCQMPVLVAHGEETSGIDFELVPSRSTRATDERAERAPPVNGGRERSFLVIDALTRDPIEEYGLSLSTRPTGHVRDPAEAPVVRSAPGGLTTVLGTQRDTAYYCRALGYALATGDLPTKRDQPVVIELVRGASLVGRVQGGAYARVQLELSSSPLDKHETQPREIQLAHAFLGQTRYVQCDANGRFELTGLSPALYDLSVRAAVEREARLESIDLREATSLDLGEIRMSPLASIEGVVKLPPGYAPEGLELQLFGSRERRCIVDSEGRFRFSGLSWRRAEIHIESDPKLCTSCRARRFELEPGEQRVVEIDLEQHVAPIVELRVHAPDEAAPRCRVFGGREHALQRDPNAGPDAPWIASLDVHCSPTPEIQLLSQQGAVLAAVKLEPRLKHGERRLVELAPSTGRLVIDLPGEKSESFALDPDSELRLELRAPESQTAVAWWTYVSAHERSWHRPHAFTDSACVELGSQVTGRWVLEAELVYRGKYGAKRRLAVERELVILPGETTRVRL